jgi:hypothetical protein
MLGRIDRVQLAVPEAETAARGWIGLLGAEPAGEDRIAGLGARRRRLRIGTGFVELLVPDGAGPVADAVARRGAHLYAAGASAPDLAGLAAHLKARGVSPLSEAGQLHLTERDIDFLYEATLLSSDTVGITRQLNTLFALDERNYTEIVSDLFGYRGTLTLFDKDELHRLEVIEPTTPGTTMERYFRKFGQSLYMAFAETSRINLIAERAAAAGAGFTLDRPDDRPAHLPSDQLWLHPKALGGMMLGLSRPSMAWTWSGHPERVEAVA